MSAKKDREARREERLQREAEAEEGSRRRRLLQFGSAAVFLAIVVVAVLIVVSQSGSDGGGDTNVEDAALVNDELQGVPQQGMTLGDEGALVTLVEFGDLQCPVCKGYAEEILPDVIESSVRSGEAKLAFRNFTIIDEDSTPAGAAAIAAGEQGRGWNFVELFYRNQGIERTGYVDDDFLSSIAEAAGVPNIARWNRERRSQRILRQVAESTEEAERLGFTGTPSFAVEGPATDGLETLSVSSAEELEAAIEGAG